MIINNKEDLEILSKVKNLMNYYNNIKTIAPIIKSTIQKAKCSQYNFNLNYLKKIWFIQLTMMEEHIDIDEEFKLIRDIIISKIQSLEIFNEDDIEDNSNFKTFEFIDNLFNVIYKENYPIYLKPMLSKHILDLKKYGFKNLSIYKNHNTLLDSIIENLTNHYFKIILNNLPNNSSLEEDTIKNILEKENFNKKVFNLEKNPLPFQYRFLDLLKIYINNKEDKEGFVFNIDYININKNIETLYSITHKEIIKTLDNLLFLKKLESCTDSEFLSELLTEIDYIDSSNFPYYFFDLDFKEILTPYYEVLFENLTLNTFNNLMRRLNDKQKQLIIDNLEFFKEKKFENTLFNIEKYMFAQKLYNKLPMKNDKDIINKI